MGDWCRWVFIAMALVGSVAVEAAVKQLTEETWKSVLEGEWMVRFYAPWCPACNEMHRAWDSFARWAEDKSVTVADVDVTTQAGLSGRFLVTALPTIYHIKNGAFRVYSGPRDTNDFIAFLEDGKWTVVDVVSAWRNPTSVQMSIVASFFTFSTKVRDLHSYFVNEKNLPAYVSYAIFAVATLVLGSVLGCVIVFVVDYLFPPSPRPGPASQSQKKKQEKKKGKGSGEAQADKSKKDS